MERKTKAATLTGTYLVLVAAVLILINVATEQFSKRLDFTKNERFTLSKGSKHLVAERLTQELLIDVYVTRGLPKYDAFVRDLTDLIGEYERASNGKVKYRVIEAKTEEQKKEAKDAGLQESAFGESSETGSDSATITRGFMGISFKYGLEKEAIPVLSPDQGQGLEFWISNKIREIRDRAENDAKKIGVLTGKDEIKLTDANLVAAQGGGQGPNIRGIIERAFPFYKFEDVDLQNGDSEINKELAGLIITQPGKDFSDKELRRIDQFVMLGDKALAVFASAVNLKASDASMKAELNTHGLEKLLAGYGVDLVKAAALDWSRSPNIPAPLPNGQVKNFRAPGIVQVQYDGRLGEDEQFLDTAFPAFFRIEEIVFPFPSPLELHPEKQPEAKVKVIARTTEDTSSDTSGAIDMKLRSDWKRTPPFKQVPIAAAVEGPLKSAMGGGEKDGVSVPDTSKSPSRVLVVASSQFLVNPFARAGNPPPMPPQMAMMGGMGGDEDLQMFAQGYAQKYLTATILAFKNTLDWMSGDLSLLATSSKLLGEPNLTYSDIKPPKLEPTDDPNELKKREDEFKAEREKTQQRVQWTLIFLGPALFAAFGVFRWRRRESKRSSFTLD